MTTTMSNPAGTASAAAARGAAGSGNPALVGVLAMVGAAAMLLTAVGGAYMSVRHGSGADFVPKEMKFEYYAGGVLAATAVLGSIAVQFALSGIRQGQSRWAWQGWALGVLFGVSSMALVWSIGYRLPFGVSDSPYAVLVYALLSAAMLLLGVAVVAVTLALMRTLGGQITAAEPNLGRAAAWAWHIAAVGSVLTYAIIFLKK